MNNDDNVLSTKEAAAFLGAHAETVRRLARQGKIPSFKIGADWRFSKEALKKWFSEQQPTSHPARVLVVDDDLEFAGYMSRTLKRLGCHPVHATDGAEALELVLKEKPDVVFLDLVMPRMNGPQFIEQLRVEHRDLPVIIVTAHPDSELMQKAARHGPVMLLNKPVEPKQVERAIRTVLGVHVKKGQAVG